MRSTKMSIGQRNSEIGEVNEISGAGASGITLAAVAGPRTVSLATGFLAASGEDVERTRRLFVAIFAASLLAHGAIALRLRAGASERALRPPSKVEVEMVRHPPPPVATPPKPLPQAEAPKPPPRLAAPKPLDHPVVAPPPVSMAGIPQTDEGTLPPAPPGDPQPIIAAAPTPVVTAAPAPTPAPAPPPPVVAAKEGANYLKNPRPAYPRVAKREGWQGVVKLRVRVLPTGRAEAVNVESSSGRSILDDAAIEAVKEWTFVPATQGGQPVAGWVTVPIDFRLQ